MVASVETFDICPARIFERRIKRATQSNPRISLRRRTIAPRTVRQWVMEWTKAPAAAGKRLRDIKRNTYDGALALSYTPKGEAPLQARIVPGTVQINWLSNVHCDASVVLEEL